jgi:hypothetical protein
MGTIIIKGEGTVEEKEPEKQSFRVSRDKERSAPKEAEKKNAKRNESAMEQFTYTVTVIRSEARGHNTGVIN